MSHHLHMSQQCPQQCCNALLAVTNNLTDTIDCAIVSPQMVATYKFKCEQNAPRQSGGRPDKTASRKVSVQKNSITAVK